MSCFVCENGRFSGTFMIDEVIHLQWSTTIQFQFTDDLTNLVPTMPFWTCSHVRLAVTWIYDNAMFEGWRRVSHKNAGFFIY